MLGIRVDYDTLETKWENVYAIGDCTDMPTSKSGGVAHQGADTLAHDLIAKIRKQGEPSPVELNTICSRSNLTKQQPIELFIRKAGRPMDRVTRARGGV